MLISTYVIIISIINAGGQHVGADPREQQLLADVSDLLGRIIEAAPQRAFDQRPGFRIRVNRGPRDKSLAARHIKARAFQKALQGLPYPTLEVLIVKFMRGQEQY